MRIFISALTLMVSLAASAETLKSTTRPSEIYPGSVTSFNEFIQTKTYVSVVSSLIGGAWLTQSVIVNVGYQEEAQESFEFVVVGEIVDIKIFEDSTQNLDVFVTTDSGSFDPDNGIFKVGFTIYKLSVKPDSGTDTGYSSQAELTNTYFSEE